MPTYLRPVMALRAFALLAALVSAACVRAPLGAECQQNEACLSGVCLRGKCEQSCTLQSQCGGGECVHADPADPVFTCRPATWTGPDTGGFGTPCALVAKGCTEAASPCAEGFVCHATVACDAKAYCTKEACGSDADCPPEMFCGSAYIDEQTFKRCFKRTFCQPCTTDDQCGTGSLCTYLPEAGERVCAPTCTKQEDCHLPIRTKQPSKANPEVYETVELGHPYELCVPDVAGRGSVCLPTTGRCHGPSAIDGVEGDGVTCSYCREGRPEDCDASTGHVCIGLMPQSHERFCTKRCTTKADCPVGARCFNEGLNDNYTKFCVADSDSKLDAIKNNITCFPLD